MRARRYKKTDYESVSSWLDERGKEHLPKHRIPKTGYIVPDVACCFLIKTDAKVGIVDFFVSNPKVEDELKIKAYDLIFPKLEEAAEKLGLEQIHAATPILKVAVLGIHVGMVKDAEYYFYLRKMVKPKLGVNDGSGINADASPSA